MAASRNKPLPSLAVVVLGLVIERPMHPYEMVQTAIARREDRLTNIRPGTLYHAVSRLEADGHIAVRGVLREGNRPERTVYEITPAGRAAYLAAVTTMLGDQQAEFPQLYMALALAHDLPRTRVVELLDKRIEAMEQEYEQLSAAFAKAADDQVPEMFFLDGGCRLATLRAQLRWLSELAQRLRDNSITWLDDPGFTSRWRAKDARCGPYDFFAVNADASRADTRSD